jgi:uncharacterized protein YidB (DUF937 family)
MARLAAFQEIEAMGLLDQLASAAMGALKGEGPAILNQVLANGNLGGLQGIVNQLQQGGLGDVVQSWLSNGANLPITADQLKAVLSNEQVQQMAAQLGIDPDEVLKLLAQHLPAAVDQASPNGQIAQN